MYPPYKNLGVDSLKGLFEGSKVWQKDWIRQLRIDLDNHGLTTKCEQDNWFYNLTTRVEFNDGGILKQMLLAKGRKRFNMPVKTERERLRPKK